MNGLRRYLPFLALFALLCANLAAGGRLYAAESAKAAAAADAKEEEISAYDMYALFARVVETVREHYVDRDKVEYDQLVEAALDGMLQNLDPHSHYMDKKAFDAMKADTSGHFGGLGITVGMRDGILTVISPMEETPAFRAGLLPGDKIIEIDGEPTDGLMLDEAVSRMRGEPGTRIKIKVFRPKTQLVKTFALERAEIRVPSVKDAEIFDGGIGYVRLVQFGETTSRDLQKVLDDFAEKKVRGLILDLRGNPGGLLTSAVEVAQKFLPRGSPIVFTRGRDGRVEQSFSARLRHPFPEVPMIVLVNGASASAAEIVSGALQDHKRAVLLGEKTYGKGSVQTVIPQQNGGAIRLTTAKYYTPSERVIHENGIEPDVVVPMNMEEWRNVLLARNAKDVLDEEDVLPSTDADGQKASEGWHALDEGVDENPTTGEAVDLDEVPAGSSTDTQLARAKDMLSGLLLFRPQDR